MSEARKVIVEVCPETGICSIVRDSGQKIDLMPDEVTQLRNADNAAAAQTMLADIDPAFAAALDADTLSDIRARLK